MTVELAGAEAELKDHRIPLEKGHERGWGRVSIPADANPADNDFWFVFEQPAPRRAIIVAEDPQAARPLQLAASISPDPALHVHGRGRRGRTSWRRSTGTRSSLLLWQAPLPEGDAAEQVRAFVERGGSAIFFPPRAPGGGELFGVRWTTWAGAEGRGARRELARRSRTCWPTRRAARRCRSGSSRSGRYCGLSAAS